MNKSIKDILPNDGFSIFKSSLPLARIKRIMKIDKDVRMISAETLNIFAKTCELFTIELACKSFVNSIIYKRRTIQVIV